MKYKCTRCGDVVELKDNKKLHWPSLIVTIIITMILTTVGIIYAVQIGATDLLVTADTCNSVINQSINQAITYGGEYTIATITQEAIQCNEIPINYGNYSYTLFAVECLNLNQGGNK